jgi:hypothetical protein
MADIKQKIHAEMENVETVLTQLETVKNRPDKEPVVLVGIGGYLQNTYNGIENILKQILLFKNISIPDSSTWHKDLLSLAVKHKVIGRETAERIGKYLFFRHFFTHSYGFLIEERKIKPLMDSALKDYKVFKKDILDYLKTAKK